MHIKTDTVQMERPESILKPVKQSCSEQGTMRTTRSKSKAKQQD